MFSKQEPVLTAAGATWAAPSPLPRQAFRTGNISSSLFVIRVRKKVQLAPLPGLWGLQVCVAAR